MEIVLNESQQRFAAIVVDQLEKTDQSRIIFGTGLTGVGKNTVLSKLLPEIQRHGGQIVPLSYLLDPANEDHLKDAQTHYLTSFAPKDYDLIQDQIVNRLGLIVVGVKVKTMNLDEALKYIEQMRLETDAVRTTQDLEDRAIAALSMGVYGHINRYFELKKQGRFYQPRDIREALKVDLPDYLRSGPGFFQYLSQLTDIPQLWGQMGI